MADRNDNGDYPGSDALLLVTGRNGAHHQRRSSNADRKDPGIFAQVVFDRMPADQESTGVLNPTSMRPLVALP